MINAIATMSLNHIERASTDEFERDILTKASAITLTPITFLELIIAAIPRDLSPAASASSPCSP